MKNNYKTLIMPPDIENLKEGAEYIKKGEVIGMPTETVYGLAADGLNEAAVLSLFKIKGRPADNPLILHIASPCDLKDLVKRISKLSIILIEKFWPGPLTIIFDKSDIVPNIVSAGLSTVAVRMPSNTIAQSIIKLSSCPIAAPSANISGKPSPTRAMDVLNDLNGKIPLIIDGGHCMHGLESTVVDARKDVIKILRPGAVTYDMLVKVSPNIILASGMLENIDIKNPESPGMKYKHYAPKANVIILKGEKEAVQKYFNMIKAKDSYILVANESLSLYNTLSCALSFGEKFNPASFGKNLYSTFRDLDSKGAKDIYIEYQGEKGILLALYNRMLRASGFKVVNL